MAETGLFFGAPIWTFTWNPPYADALRRLAKTGCKGFELAAWSVDMLGYYTPEVRSELKAIADGEGLTLTNFFFNLPFSRNAGDTVSSVDIDAFKRGLDMVAEVGSPIVTTINSLSVPVGHPPHLAAPDGAGMDSRGRAELELDRRIRRARRRLRQRL